MYDCREALAGAVAAALEAGALLRDGQEHPGHARRFDVRAEELIRQRLGVRGDWAYLSDESGHLPAKHRSHVWLVDPDDGTFHFNLGARGSAVCVAALRDGVPVLGVVYAFAYPDDRGDLLAWAEGCGPITRNGAPAGPPLDAALDDPKLAFHHRLIVFLSPGADHFPHLAAARVAPARHVVVPSGGDTDTTAAIAGALLGAAHGRDAVPARWRLCVQSCRMFDGAPTRHPRGREYWPVDVLELAECLLLAGRTGLASGA